MPIFNYRCLECKYEWEQITMLSQSNFPEPYNCPNCKSIIIEKVISAPAFISMEGKRALRETPDPSPPLQNLRGKNKPNCEGGFRDLEEFKPTERKKDKDGNWIWSEKKRQYIDMGKK